MFHIFYTNLINIFESSENLFIIFLLFINNKSNLYFLMSTVSLLLLYTYEMKIIITYYQISFEIFMLYILHILYMDPHVSKYIIY
jgi:hypothetical protein